MTTMVERALATAKIYPGEREEILAARSRLILAGERLLPIEQDARNLHAVQLNELDARLEQIAFGNLPLLDPSVFSWTKPAKGWRKFGVWVLLKVPVFAYIPVEASQCTISLGGGSFVSTEPRMPFMIEPHYATILRAIAAVNGRSAKRRNIQLRYTYAGSVPDHIRQLVREKREMFDGMGFICEVDRWQIDQQQIPREFFDPILVGIKNGRIWVLASFDPTPVEQYALNEFSS